MRFKSQKRRKGMFCEIKYNHYNFPCFIATHVLDFDDCTQLNIIVPLFCFNKIFFVYILLLSTLHHTFHIMYLTSYVLKDISYHVTVKQPLKINFYAQPHGHRNTWQ